MTRVLVTCALIVLGGLASAAAQEKPATPQTTVDASRGGVTIASGVNSLTIGARAQFRWTVDDREQFDADTAGTGAGEEDGAFSQFDVARLRLTFSGGVFRPWMRYQFQLELSRAGGEGGSRIKDAVLEFRPPDRPYRFQVGQFKAPFGLQQLTSSGRLQFVDRAITDNKFNPGRDMGAMFAGQAATRRVGYEVGVFNGSGESVRQNTRSALWVGRVFVDPLGAYSLAEGSADAPERPVVHVGAAIRGGRAIKGRTASGVVEDADNQLAYNLEFAFKAPRFYSTAEHFWMIDERQNPVTAADVDSRGFHVQGGVMVLPRRVDLGVLYARVTGDTSVDDAEVTEVRGVVGYYWQAHNLKLQADIGQVGYGSRFASLPSIARQGLPSLGTRLVAAEDLSDTQLRVQLTLTF
jgi:phosphate-selective porin OprO and OprP